MSVNEKFNYNERFYEEVDGIFREWRRTIWEDALGEKPPQEAGNQIGPSGWLEVLDSNGNVIVNIDGDGVVWAHANTHEDGGTDEIDLTALSGIPAELQLHIDDTTAHTAANIPIVDIGTYYTGLEVEAALQEVGAALAAAITDHGALSGLADDDHPQYATNAEFDDHSARHEENGADELLVESLGTAEMNNALVLKPDGAGGLTWGAAGSGGTITLKEDNVLVANDVATIDFGTGFDVTSLAGEAEVSIDLLELTAFTDHSARHEDGGADEISVAALSGELADAQKVKDHTHAATGTGANGGGNTLEPTTITMPNGGVITIGDVALSRGAANILQTEDDFYIYGALSDANPMLEFLATAYGAIGFGPGGATAVDVILGRTAAGEMSFDLASGGAVVNAGKFKVSSGGVLTYVPIAASSAVSGTTAANIGVTLTATIAALPAGAIAAEVQITCSSTTANVSNTARAWSGLNSAHLQGQAYNGAAANYPTTTNVTVPLDSSRRFYYSVVRAAGTVSYNFDVVGYWIDI